MKVLSTRTHEIFYHLAILFLIVSLSGYGGGKSSKNRETSDRSASLSFQIDIATPSGHIRNVVTDNTTGAPDICNNYAIDIIDENIFRFLEISFRLQEAALA